jgi:hypothetical protein
MARGHFRLDPTTNPRQIDFVWNARDESQKAIYQLEGDVLKVYRSRIGRTSHRPGVMPKVDASEPLDVERAQLMGFECYYRQDAEAPK